MSGTTPPRSARRSLLFSLLDRYASLAVNILATMVLARLLAPAELGVFSVAMAMLMFAATVRDLGAGNYLLQERELTTERIRAVWAVQLGVGLGLGLVVASLSGIASRFYDQPALQPVMWVLALNYAVNPFGSITYAWLMREMRYDAVAVMRFASVASGALLSVVLAWRGHGTMSLAWGSLCTTVVNAVVATRFRPSHFPWLPSLREVRRVLGFGGRMTAASVMTTVSTATPEFLLGKLQGMTATGLYSRANGLVALFNRLVTDAVYPVALSLFASQSRAGEPTQAGFLRAVQYMCVLSWSFLLTLAVLAEPTLEMLYGHQWVTSAPVTRWLALVAAFQAPVALCMAMLTGSGKPQKVLRATAFAAATNVAAAAAGATVDMHAVAMGLALASMLNATVWLAITGREIGIGTNDVVAPLWRSVVVATAAALPPALLTMSGLAAGRPVALALGGWILSGGAFIVALRLLRHPLQDEAARIGRALRARVSALQAR